MAEVTIREKVWHDFVELAQQLRRKPQALAESVLRDYVQRVEDEKLLADSRRDALRANLEHEDIEELIRAFRKKKAATVMNGRAKKAGARGA